MTLLPIGFSIFFHSCTEFEVTDVSQSEKVQPDIEVYPDSLEFGVLEGGQESTQFFTITSTGNVAVELNDILVVGSSSYTISWVEEQRESLLEPDESLDIFVTYSPNSIQEYAGVQVHSNAIESTKIVGLNGSGSYPAISVTPSVVSFNSTDGNSVQKNVLVESVGTATLEVYEHTLFGENFEISSDMPLILEPQESYSMMVTYHPDNDQEKDIGNLWLSHNTEIGSSMVYLEGTMEPDCYGLSEAWDRGFLEINTTFTGSIVFQHIGGVEEPNICMDEWYVILSENSQDAGVGDPNYDPGGIYPLGSITLEPSDSISFMYQGSGIPSWYCMELTQHTFFTYQWEFLGARVPEPILSMMLGEDQQGVWDWMEANPSVVLGRSNHLLRVNQQDSVVLRVINMGQISVTTTVTELIPPEFEVYFTSQTPQSLEILDDGSTLMTFDVSLGPSQLTDTDNHTLYDEVNISYKISPKAEPCFGRFYGNPPVAQWLDSTGAWRFSEASPLVILCE